MIANTEDAIYGCQPNGPATAADRLRSSLVWNDRFAEQYARLMDLLKSYLAEEIERIGSTSVRGSRSSRLSISSAGAIAVRAAIPILEADGWLYWPDDPNHHYRLWVLEPNPSARTHHLQIIQHDHPDSFRDALRSDAKQRDLTSS